METSPGGQRRLPKVTEKVLLKTCRQDQVPGLAEAGAAAEIPLPSTQVSIDGNRGPGHKGLAWVTQELPRGPFFLLRRAGLRSIQGGWAEGLQGPDPTGKALTWVLGWPSGHKEEVGPLWAQRLLSRWPSPWLQLMITLSPVNTDHKCSSKGIKPWTVLGQVGQFQEASAWAPPASPGGIRSQPSKPCYPVMAWPTAPRDRGQ